jgi:predicted glycosyltransferase
VEENSGPIDILFFSRGRGRGHAVRDLEIVRTLRDIHVGVKVVFVSYGTGGRVLAGAGEIVIDIDLPDQSGFVDVAVRAGQVLRRHRAKLVVSHEEPAALCAAKIFDLPTAYMSHWLPPIHDADVRALAYADEVLLLEHERIRPEPAEVGGRVKYIGPVLRALSSRPSDRDRCRAELGIDPAETVILVLPGTGVEQWGTAKIVFQAFKELRRTNSRVIWVGGEHQDEISHLAAGIANVTVIPETGEPDGLMVAADVAVTTGSYNINKELAALGVPSITLSNGRNANDDLFARSTAGNVFLWSADTDGATLATHIDRLLDSAPREPHSPLLTGRNAAAVAAILSSRIWNPQ